MFDPEDPKFKFVLDRIRNEERLIAERLGWLLSSQTIFLGIYAFLRTNNEFEDVVDFAPLAALLIGTINYVGILAAIIAIYDSCNELENNSEKQAIIGKTKTHILGFISPIASPLTFFIIWILVIFRYSSSGPIERFVTTIVAIIIAVLFTAIWELCWIFFNQKISIIRDKLKLNL